MVCLKWSHQRQLNCFVFKTSKRKWFLFCSFLKWSMKHWMGVLLALVSDWFVLFYRVLHVSRRQRVLFATPRYNLKKLFVVFNFFYFFRSLYLPSIPTFWFCVAKHSAFDFLIFLTTTATQSQVEPSPKICVNFFFVFHFVFFIYVRSTASDIFGFAVYSLQISFPRKRTLDFLCITHVSSPLENF